MINRSFDRRTWLGMALAAAVGPRAASAQQTAPIRVGSATGDSYSEPFVGEQLGIFKKAGIDVVTTPFANGGQIAAAMIGGSLDVGLSDPITIANAVLRGLPLGIIAGGGLYRSTAPTSLLCVSKTSTYHDARSLEGQTIGLFNLFGLAAVSTKAWLTTGGADLSKIKIVELTQPEMFAAIERGTISAGIVAEPYFAPIKTNVRVLAKPYDAIAQEFCTVYWFTTRDWVTKNPQLAKKLVASIYDTARYANVHTEQTLPVLAATMKMSVDQLSGATRTSFATGIDAGGLQAIVDQAVKFKAMEHAVDINSMLISV